MVSKPSFSINHVKKLWKHLVGRNIYDGCSQLDIQYSNLNELQVRFNNDRSRDFTNPSLPTEQRPRPSQHGFPDPGGVHVGHREAPEEDLSKHVMRTELGFLMYPTISSSTLALFSCQESC